MRTHRCPRIGRAAALVRRRGWHDPHVTRPFPRGRRRAPEGGAGALALGVRRHESGAVTLTTLRELARVAELGAADAVG